MKKSSFVCAAAFFALSLSAFAGEFRDKGEIIAADFPSGWAQEKSDDPLVTLKLVKGKAAFEFAKQDSQLSDYYLKARVKENVESLRGKGAAFYGDIKPLSLHGVSNAYYAAYEMLGSRACMAFFTYNGASYSIAARGVDEGEFRGILSSVRRPGEKIEPPKRPRAPRVKQEKEEEYGVGLFNDEEPEKVSVAVTASSPAVATAGPEAAAVVDTQPSAVQAAANSAGQAAQNLMDELARKSMEKSSAPYFARKPLPAAFWGGLLLFWFLGSFVARGIASSYQNPKLSPPPAEVPPDFFFPFVAEKSSSFMEVSYNVLTRQRQLLLASFPYEHEPYLVGGVYGCAFFHAVWSLLEFTGRGGVVGGALLRLPFGRFVAALPEIFFILPFFYGLCVYIMRKRILRIYDAQSSLVMEARPEITYCLIRDGGGKEVARLVAKESSLGRRWEFVDTDNLVIFSVQDDYPKIRLLRKIFGNLGGALRARYGIFVQDRRAGFVFLDPFSGDRFQVHMDFSFARLAPPAQMLAAILYIISKEKDPIYPSPF